VSDDAFIEKELHFTGPGQQFPSSDWLHWHKTYNKPWTHGAGHLREYCVPSVAALPGSAEGSQELLHLHKVGWLL